MPSQMDDSENNNNDDQLHNENTGPSEPDEEEEVTNEIQKHVNKFSFILTNARSLAPKIDSFIENFHERDADICVDERGILFAGG